ncbi:MAG: putative viral replication protein [Circoviridae sp.]|nr:MAG: putative viral replication protein [Circoviridae sp.]
MDKNLNEKWMDQYAIGAEHKGAARHYVFTDYNEERIENGYELSDKIRGIRWGRETCPTTGKTHNQGYVQFFKQQRFKGAMTALNTKCYLAVARGNLQDNIEYTSKEGDAKAIGHFVKQGQHLKGIVENHEAGNTLLDIVENDEATYIKYHGGIDKVYGMLDNEKYSKLIRNVSNYIIWGDTGVGKTTSIINKYGIENCFLLTNVDGDNKYFTNYNGESILIIDDFYSWLHLSVLLKILDNQPYQTRGLYRSGWARWTEVYITSNEDPDLWYKETVGEKRKALFRRFKKRIEVSKGNNGTLDTNIIEFDTKSEKQIYLDLDKDVFKEKSCMSANMFFKNSTGS